jgi:V8-like Glu-specific endopeptidase
MQNMKKPLLHGGSFILLLATVLPAACSESTTHNEPTTDECGDIKPAVFPVINGAASFDPSVVNLTSSQVKAVGALAINYGGGMCSATLVAPNVVLTAAHCVADPGIHTLSFLGGEDLMRPDFNFAGREWHAHPMYTGVAPEYDLGVVIIEGDTAAQGITPIPPSCETTRLIGQVIQAVGYGATSTSGGWNTRRWWTTLAVTRESPNYYSAYGNDVTGTCQGDSGGPMLYTMDDGLPYVMGVVSSGDSEDCLGNTYYPRTDFHCDFIREYIPADPCEGETLQGRCDGTTAVWCETETVFREDCSVSGKQCAQDASGNSRCQNPPDPCQGETFEGRCDGNTAIWCEADAVTVMPCGGETLCGALEDGLSRCIDECTLIGRTGRCDDSGMARWCEEGSIKVRDCPLCMQTCGWVDDTMGYYCL